MSRLVSGPGATGGVVLVTGAAGLVGTQVCRELLARGRTVLALVHRVATLADADGPVHSPRLHILRGDVTREGLGLSAEDAALAEAADTVVHAAATTDFAAPQEVYDTLNVGGTRHVVGFATGTGARLVHVSTTYLCGRFENVAGPAATFTEAMLDEGQPFDNGYEESKSRAEAEVRRAGARGLDVAVVRPGIVCGHSRSGRLREYRNLYLVLKLITEGKLRTLPGRYGATLALAPIDLVTRVIADVVTTGVTGRTFHAVGADEITLRDVSDVLAEYPCFHVNTFVPTASFSPDQLGRRERLYYDRVGRDYTAYFDRTVRFGTTNVRLLLAETGGDLPASGPDLLRRLVDDCLRTGYLADGLPDVDTVVAAHAGAGTGGVR